MKTGDICGEHDCGGKLKVAGEWGAIWVLQCLRCFGFVFKFKDTVTDDPADAYDRSLIEEARHEG